MRKALMVLALSSLSACAAKEEKENTPMIGMANPASVHCVKLGGKLDIVKTEAGEVGYCTLPSGERVEEWTLFRRESSNQ